MEEKTVEKQRTGKNMTKEQLLFYVGKKTLNKFEKVKLEHQAPREQTLIAKRT